ncbi:hypothetical protein AmDm5_2139 [Acetobacter malorum]|nr:hypothetical protein AmDm5_2139 [Acetobacter malorum]
MLMAGVRHRRVDRSVPCPHGSYLFLPVGGAAPALFSILSDGVS